MLKKAVEKRKYNYPDAMMFYCGAIAVMLVCQFLAGIVAIELKNGNPSSADEGIFSTACMIVFQAANFAFIVLFAKKTKKSNNFSVFGDVKKFDVFDFLLPPLCAVLLFGGLYLPTLWYGYFTHYVLGFAADAGAVDLSATSSVVMIVIASVFLAPIAEETIYRGVLLNGLKEKYSPFKSVMLCALAFMLMHMSPIQVVFQFGLGTLSAVIMARTKKLFPCIILHAVANAVALVLQLTDLASVLIACEQWLTANVGFALFITVALFALCGGLLFLAVKYGFGYANKRRDRDTLERITNAIDGIEQPKEDGGKAQRKVGGVGYYWITVSICSVVFLINLIALAVG